MTNRPAGESRPRSRAARLLSQVLTSDRCDVGLMASQLVVDEPTLARYASGEMEMPVDRQICLARFLIDGVPGLSRQGHNLLSQVQAAVRFSQSETVVHQTNQPPK